MFTKISDICDCYIVERGEEDGFSRELVLCDQHKMKYTLAVNSSKF